MKTEILAILFAGVALAAALPPVSAQAAEAASARNRAVVRLGDLDLDQPTHARIALVRLHKAATRVCRDRPAAYPNLIARSERLNRCRTATLATALARLDAPKVYQAFDETRRARATRLAWR